MEDTLTDNIVEEPEVSGDNNKQDISFDLLTTDSYEISKKRELEEHNDSTEQNVAEPNVISDNVEESILLEESSSIPESAPEDVKNDLKNIFAIANQNVKEATDIFNKNLEMKRKLEDDRKEFDRVRGEHTEKCREEIRKVKEYKAEVYEKLKAKKAEVESQIQDLKDLQATFNLEKNKFEFYKKNEMDKIKKQEEKRQSELDTRESILEEREQELFRRESELEEQKELLSKDRSKYEADMNELSNNLSKFNQLVGEFTSNVEKISE